MPRRSSFHHSIEIELFPFLSILACTIGTLILLIIVLTTQVFSNQQEIKIIAITEAGKNQQKQPRYLECREDGIVVYPDKTFVPGANIESSNIVLSELFYDLRQNREREYLIVAVRPDGIEVFQKVRDLIEQQGIDIGYEPIDENWQLKIE